MRRKTILSWMLRDQPLDFSLIMYKTLHSLTAIKKDCSGGQMWKIRARERERVRERLKRETELYDVCAGQGADV